MRFVSGLGAIELQDVRRCRCSSRGGPGGQFRPGGRAWRRQSRV